MDRLKQISLCAIFRDALRNFGSGEYSKPVLLTQDDLRELLIILWG